MTTHPLEQRLVKMALDGGATGAAVVAVKDIPFRREFRDACAQNACGKYGTCWMCPPDVGDIDAMIAEAKEHNHAFVFQTIGQLEDSYDFEGMEEAAKRHNSLAQSLWPQVREPLNTPLRLGAGACHVCAVCSRTQDKPCPYPDDAIASLESYGIAVYELAPLCGLKYINGPDTVTYFGAFLFH